MFLKIKKSLGTPQSQNKTFKNYKIVIKIELQKISRVPKLGSKMVLKILEKMQKGLKRPKTSRKVSNIHFLSWDISQTKKLLTKSEIWLNYQWNLIVNGNYKKEPHPIVVAWPPL